MFRVSQYFNYKLLFSTHNPLHGTYSVKVAAAIQMNTAMNIGAQCAYL